MWSWHQITKSHELQGYDPLICLQILRKVIFFHKLLWQTWIMMKGQMVLVIMIVILPLFSRSFAFPLITIIPSWINVTASLLDFLSWVSSPLPSSLFAYPLKVYSFQNTSIAMPPLIRNSSLDLRIAPHSLGWCTGPSISFAYISSLLSCRSSYLHLAETLPTHLSAGKGLLFILQNPML